ncbi:MAG: hypothetical protein ACFFAN_10030 [Promethearchaeota archaeon]
MPVETEEWLNQLKKYRKSEPEKKGIISESDEELMSQIRVAAYFLSINNLSYNDLCWLLSEKELIIQKGYDNITEKEIKQKAEEIYRSTCSYEELCWLNAELKILEEKGYFNDG